MMQKRGLKGMYLIIIQTDKLQPFEMCLKILMAGGQENQPMTPD
jgi:hypothetical protein